MTPKVRVTTTTKTSRMARPPLMLVWPVQQRSTGSSDDSLALALHPLE